MLKKEKVNHTNELSVCRFIMNEYFCRFIFLDKSSQFKCFLLSGSRILAESGFKLPIEEHWKLVIAPYTRVFLEMRP